MIARRPVNGPFEKDRWELYNVETDFSQAEDLAAKNAENLKELQALFLKEAVVTRNGNAVAVLLGVRDDDELERLLLAHSWKFPFCSHVPCLDNHVYRSGGTAG